MLIIGRRKPHKGDEFGGVVVLYELFLSYFKDNEIAYEDIDINWRNYPNKLIFLLVIYFIIIKAILFSKWQSISFHGTTTDFTYYAPLVVLLGRLKKKRVTLRKFGGNFDRYYKSLGLVRKLLVSYALKNANCVFYETKYLVREFSSFGSGVWFPNVRKGNAEKNINSNFQKRFVFISHIKNTKGVNIILEAIQKLPNEYVIHLYGPQQDYYPPPDMTELFNCHYKGALEPSEVLDKLNQYNVLLLPTYHEGEGYPGAIIEAYSQGLPVISTRWRSIPEIVEDGKTGFLVQPKSVDELVDAIMKVDAKNYSQLSVNSLNFFEKFDQKKVMNRIINHL